MGLNKYLDHTLLKPEATAAQIDQVTKEALENGFYSVMVNPYWVKRVKRKVAGTKVKAACVIGFPLGANATAIKVAEAEQAINDGADEIDMVMNIGEFKGQNYTVVSDDISAVVKVAHDAKKVIKVIIETALLTEEEITKASIIVADADADFVKTSTGFSTRGAEVHDVELMKAAVGGRIKIKPAGGIHSADEAEKMIAAGANRLGVSASMKIIGK
ncbi:TPA: deoxyribose-phosphate aldolase [Enterococcus faecium]|nr:deoxyribose-phosphate aldolase [Enterococcus faecium]